MAAVVEDQRAVVVSLGVSREEEGATVLLSESASYSVL